MKKFCFLSLLLLLPLALRAQDSTVAQNLGVENILVFTISPDSPGPNTRVTANLTSSSIDLDTANINWTLNGSKIAGGRGVTSATFTTGDVGAKENLAVNVTTKDGSSLARSIDLTPSVVDLVWQGNTYVPAFYKGRSLWGYQSPITILAVPHVVGSSGSALDQHGLIYEWSLDGSPVGTASGTGRNTFTFTDSVLAQPRTVSVEITTGRDQVVGQASLTVAAGAPQLLVYEDNPLYGVLFNRAVSDNTTLRDKEVTFGAFPFFMSAQSRTASSLVYNWNLNGADSAQTGEKVTYRAPIDSSGSSSVHVDARNSNTVLQGGQKDFLVQFGNTNASF